MSACAHPKERCHDFIHVCPVCNLRAKTRQPVEVAIPQGLTPEQAMDPPCCFRQEGIGKVPCSCKTRELDAYGCKVKGRCTVSSTYLPKEKDVEVCRLCESR